MDTTDRSRLLTRLRAHLAACRRLRTERETDGLLRLLAGIADPEIRLFRFAEHLRPRPADEAAWTLAYVQERVAAGSRAAHQVGLGLLDKSRLGRVLPSGHLEAAAAFLDRRGHPSAGLFLDQPKRPDTADEDTAPRPSEPVGYRISQARQAITGALERMLFDPDPRVVQTILGNPRLTEADVVKLAASRRASPEILETVAQDTRWVARYQVKLALAGNPTTPTRIVLGLIPYLMKQDLRTLSTRANRGAIRDKAAAFFARRPGA
jgi:hypothetical protein